MEGISGQCHFRNHPDNILGSRGSREPILQRPIAAFWYLAYRNLLPQPPGQCPQFLVYPHPDGRKAPVRFPDDRQQFRPGSYLPVTDAKHQHIDYWFVAIRLFIQVEPSTQSRSREVAVTHPYIPGSTLAAFYANESRFILLGRRESTEKLQRAQRHKATWRR